MKDSLIKNYKNLKQSFYKIGLRIYIKLLSLIGFFRLKKLERNENIFYLICPFGIGDIVFALKAIENKNIDKKLCVLVRSQHKSLQKIYPDVEFCANTDLCKSIEQYIIASSKYETEHHLYCHFKKNEHDGALLHNIQGNPNGLWIDYCNEVYHIDPSIMKNCSEKAVGKSEVLLTSKDIVLMPYAHTTDMIPMDFWEILAQKLLEKGYNVYSNIAPYEKPVKGTKPLYLPLDAVCVAFENSAGCISMRSGICDLLAIKSETPLYILNTSEKWMPIWDAAYFRAHGIENFLFQSSDSMLDILNKLF